MYMTEVLRRNMYIQSIIRGHSVVNSQTNIGQSTLNLVVSANLFDSQHISLLDDK